MYEVEFIVGEVLWHGNLGPIISTFNIDMSNLSDRSNRHHFPFPSVSVYDQYSAK